MGNNGAHSCTDTNCTKGKSIVSVYKLPEPNVNEIYNGKAIKVITLNINYSSGNFPTNRADSESLFVVRHCYELSAFIATHERETYLKIFIFFLFFFQPVNINYRTTQEMRWEECLEISI
jgi:hypothetical protein